MSDLEDTFSRSLQSFLSHPGHKTSNCNFLEPLPLWKTSLESPPFPSFPTASPSPLSHPDEALLHPPGCCSTARSRRCWAHIHQGSPWPAADVRREDEKREWTVQWFPGGQCSAGSGTTRHEVARAALQLSLGVEKHVFFGASPISILTGKHGGGAYPRWPSHCT